MSKKTHKDDDLEALAERLERVSLRDAPVPPIWRYVPSRKTDASLVPVPLVSYIQHFRDCLHAMHNESDNTADFVFLDTEGRVYVNEIAAVTLDGKVEVASKIVSDPFFLRKDPHGAVPVNHFWEELSSKLSTKHGACYVCVHNAFSHDLPVLLATSNIPERFVFVDTLLFFWAVFGGWSLFRERVPSCTLENLSKTISGKTHTEKTGAHTALGDARMLRHVTLTVIRRLAASHHVTEKHDWETFRTPEGDEAKTLVRRMLAWIKLCSTLVPVSVIQRDAVGASVYKRIDLEPNANVYVSKRAVTAPRQPVMHAFDACTKMPRHHVIMSYEAASKSGCRKCEVCFTIRVSYH